MHHSWNDNAEAKSKLMASMLFFCVAGGVGSLLLTPLNNVPPSDWETPAEIAAKMSPFVFSCAGVLILFKPRVGYSLGLIAGLIFLPWFVSNEFSSATRNSWVALNYESPLPIPSPEGAYLAFTKLKIVSAALVVAAGA
jgi:hypothetical protein